MNQQQNAISLARVSAISLVGKSQVWSLVKHRVGWKILISVSILSVLASCESNATSSTNRSNELDTVVINSLFQNKGIHWIARNIMFRYNTAFPQPDSNITNIAFDTIPPLAHRPSNCDLISPKSNLCSAPGQLEFLDSSLDLKRYSNLVLSFYTDSLIQNLSIALAKREKDTFYFTQSTVGGVAQDSNELIKSVNSTTGLNTVVIPLQTSKTPSSGTGYSLSFNVPDSNSSPNQIQPPVYARIHHLQFKLIP